MKTFSLITLISFFAIQINFAQVKYTPIAGGDLAVSTPEAEGMSREILDELYIDASELENIYSVLVLKNGALIAEAYFNGSSIDNKTRIASVTKSFTSALTGIAIREGILKSAEQKMLEFFPEIETKITDIRKKEITIRHLLQMRAGFPWEETREWLWDLLLKGYYIPAIEEVPLTGNPGTVFNYSNLSSNWLGIIINRASGKRLLTFAEEYLFEPMNIIPGDWQTDADGHNNGCANLFLRARDLAKFGLMYQNNGTYNGKQIVPAEWVKESLKLYSYDAWVSNDRTNFMGNYLTDLNYGYQWWSASVNGYRFNFAWGHGGQLIVLLNEYDMVLVITSYPFFLEHDDNAWMHETANIDLAGRFIYALTKPEIMPPKIGIHAAAGSGDLDAIKKHITAGTDINKPDVFGSTPLIIAATFGHKDVAFELIDSGADLNVQNKEGSTAVFTAAFFCRKEILRKLLDNGADKNIKNNKGASPLGIVKAPFALLKPAYEMIEQSLAPYGLDLDLERIEKTRPEIAEMLK